MLIFRTIEGIFYFAQLLPYIRASECACRKALMVSISQRSVPFPTKLHSVFHVFHYIEPAMRRKFVERLMLGLSRYCNQEFARVSSNHLSCLNTAWKTMNLKKKICNISPINLVERLCESRVWPQLASRVKSFGNDIYMVQNLKNLIIIQLFRLVI